MQAAGSLPFAGAGGPTATGEASEAHLTGGSTNQIAAYPSNTLGTALGTEVSEHLHPTMVAPGSMPQLPEPSGAQSVASFMATELARRRNSWRRGEGRWARIWTWI